MIERELRVLLGPRHLPEDLLLRLEVVVEGPVRQTGPFGDVRDACLEEAVLLEDLLGRIEEPEPRPCPFRRSGADRLVGWGRRTCPRRRPCRVAR